LDRGVQRKPVWIEGGMFLSCEHVIVKRRIKGGKHGFLDASHYRGFRGFGCSLYMAGSSDATT
jgi:hypothetical protein